MVTAPLKLPYTYAEQGEAYAQLPSEGANLVEFRLLFDGVIGSDSRAPIKHEIRRAFHPQLRRLWTVNRNLRQMSEHYGRMFHAHMQDKEKIAPSHPSDDEARQFAFQHWGQNWNCGPFHFVPRVTKELGAICKIEILLLRPDDDTHVTEHGDLDGHVKTLFDALRTPHKQDETGYSVPTDDETPFFCLLEDDRLVSELHVTADKLLLPPHKTTVTKNDAFAIVTVTVKHKYPDTYDQWFA